MTLDDRQIRQIADQVAERLARTMDCACRLDERARREMPHLLGMVRDLGDDNYGRGIERMRRAFRLVDRLARAGERIGLAVVIFVCVSVTGGLLTALYAGLRWLLGQPQGK